MKMNNKKIIVTGGAGFIGSHVVDLLLNQQNDVMIVDDFSTGKWKNIEHHNGNIHLIVEKADIRDLEKMISISKSVDVIFHLAVACLRTSIKNPAWVHEVNATGTLNLCRAALKNQVSRFIYISSSEVYGSAAYVPMDEKHPLYPMTVYGASKAAGELYAQAYWRTYGLPTMSVRPFNTYGPREPAEDFRAEVIPKFVLRSMAGLKPIIFGNGKQTRDFTWVEDTARGIIQAAECDEMIGQVVNIACGHEVSIEEISRIVAEKLGKGDQNAYYLQEGRPGDVMRHYADIGKARQLFNYSPSVGIDTGISKYIQWIYSENVDISAWLEQEQVCNW